MCDLFLGPLLWFICLYPYISSLLLSNKLSPQIFLYWALIMLISFLDQEWWNGSAGVSCEVAVRCQPGLQSSEGSTMAGGSASLVTQWRGTSVPLHLDLSIGLSGLTTWWLVSDPSGPKWKPQCLLLPILEKSCSVTSTILYQSVTQG